MIPVEEAVQRIVAAFKILDSETVALDDALGRTLAQNAVAAQAQPPAAMSAMDGYAVRSADKGARKVIGAAPAGHPFAGQVGANQAVRIFTGAVMPDGADAVMMQEKASREGDQVSFDGEIAPGRSVRPQGLDFAKGDILARAGQCLNARDLALLAAGDVAQLSVRRRPRIAFAATGDELSRAGESRKAGGIIASSAYGLKALLTQWGAEPRDLGILPDKPEAIAGIGARAGNADLILTLGGASVGEHDLIQKSLGPDFKLDFWKIAMRPGKPLIFGRLGHTPFIGLPGNPVSTLVCALLFVRPAIEKMLGRQAPAEIRTAFLAVPLGANDDRQDYVRAGLEWRDGQCWATPLLVQDSSLLRLYAQAQALIVRKPLDPARAEGTAVDIFPLD